MAHVKWSTLGETLVLIREYVTGLRMDEFIQCDYYLHSIAGFPRVCSLYVYFCGAGGRPKFSPNASCSADAVNHFKSQPWQWPHPLLPARGHGMLGWGQHTKLGIRETIRWLLGEINLLAAASSFTLSAAARVTGMFLPHPKVSSQRLNSMCCSHVTPWLVLMTSVLVFEEVSF